MSDELFYTAEGLRRVAQLVQDMTDLHGVTQKALAEESGIPRSMITKVLLNIHNHDRIAGWIRPTTLIKLAPAIINPETGRKFTPSELLTVATCFKVEEK